MSISSRGSRSGTSRHPSFSSLTSNTSQDSDPVRLLRLRVIAGHNLAKKDIFGASDPYVRIDLMRNDDDIAIDSVYTKTKKKAS